MVKKLLSLVMMATMFGAVFLPLQSARAGSDGLLIPDDECGSPALYQALENGAELIYAADYNGVVWAGSGSQVIIGTEGDDVIHGGSGHDVICGVSEDDGDKLYGGSGNDYLIPAVDGKSDLYGESGSDQFDDDGWDADDCNGGSGHDTSYVDCDSYQSIED